MPTLNFEQETNQIYRKHAIIGLWLGIIFVPFGNLLDRFVYPDLANLILFVRVICALCFLLMLFLFKTSWGKSHVRFLSISWAMLPAWAICWMIYRSEGFASSYWAGLMLVLAAVCILLPYTLKEAIVHSLLFLGSYIVAGLLHHFKYATSIDASHLVIAFFFLGLNSAIYCTSCYFRHAARLREFNLRDEVGQKNQALTESYEKLLAMDKVKSEFIANISHEFRTPLTLIISPAERLLQKNDALPPKVYETLRMIIDNGLRLLKLVNDLLESIRLDQEDVAQLSLRPIRLSSFLKGIVNSVSHLALPNNLKLKVEQGRDGIFVNADPHQMEKVFLNLLMNAIKFTEKGGTITVCWHMGQGEVLIDIQDTGIGIPESEQAKIFDRFYQIDGSATRRFQGVGIGLALVKEIVEKHNGTLSLHSEVDKGSRFTVALPLLGQKPENFLSHIEELGANEMGATFQSAERFLVPSKLTSNDHNALIGRGNYTLLIVDDENTMQHFLVELLAEKYTIIQAEDGETALALALEKKPDLVLLDWMLPKKNGLEVCEILREHYLSSNLKIIMLTARMDESSKQKGLEAGADDFLTKPFSPLELETRINNLLKLRQAEGIFIQKEKMNTLSYLSAGLLHEMNNPINYAVMAIRSIKKQASSNFKDSNKLIQCSNDVEDGITRISNIIADLRTFSNPQNRSKKVYFSLKETLEKALRLTAYEIKPYKLIKEIPHEYHVKGIPVEIEHVFINLIMNAAQALKSVASKREPVIKIEAKEEIETSKIKIRVWDNGVGIKADRLKNIFDPFYTSKKVGEGMGLGLTICYMIIQDHESVLQARSREGEWSEMFFSLAFCKK